MKTFSCESLRRYLYFPLFVSLSLSVFSLSPCLSSLSSLLGSQLALFLWPFDLGERVWSFKVLLFPLSGAPLFLLSGLGFQSGGSVVAVAGWVRVVGGRGGWCRFSMRWWDWGEVGGEGVCVCVWCCQPRSGENLTSWLIPIPSKTPTSHLTQPLVATSVMCVHSLFCTFYRGVVHPSV